MIALISLALATEPTLSQVHGWQGDTYFVVETEETSYGEITALEPDRVDPVLFYGDRYSVWGTRHRTLIRHTDHDDASLPGPTNEAGWAHWLGAQSFANSSASRQLTGGATLRIRSPEDGHWEGGTWTYDGQEEGNITVGVQSSGEGWWPVLDDEYAMTAWGYPHRSIQLYPSPSGRWVAIYIQTNGMMTMRGGVLATSTWTFHQVRPLVSVLAPAGQSSHAETVATALREPGNGLLQTGTAQSTRQTTTVYFKPEFESDAQRMARSLGPDTQVETMSWDGPQDIVIALGPP